jgi:enamine deaminase RidA (YjgF/YER057c/UK114 family)
MPQDGTTDPNTNSNTTTAAANLTAAFGQLGKNVLNNSTNLADWGKALASGTNALGDFVGSIEGIGAPLEALTRATGRVSEGMLTMIQVAGTNFENLARSGFTFSDGLSGATRAALTAGVSLESFSKFVDSNSKGLRLFANSTGLAGDSLAEFSRASSSFRSDSNNYAEGLRRLGFSNEEINESLVNFASLNRLSYLQNQASDTERNRAAFRFALEMDRMAQLTGQSRKELMKKMEEDRRNGRVQAFLRGLSADGQKAFLDGQAAAAAAGPLAKRAYEDMMMQGSLTGQSANAAAIYGQDFLDMLTAQRAQLQNLTGEGDIAGLQAFNQSMAQIQGEAIAALGSERNRSVAVLGAQGEYIQALQAEFRGQTDLYDQTLTLMQQGMTAQEARLEVFRQSLLRQGDVGVDTTGDTGLTTDQSRVDQATRLYTSLITGIDKVNLAINTNLVDALQSTPIQNAMGTAADGVTTASNGLVAAINNGADAFSAKILELFPDTGPGMNNGLATPDQTTAGSGGAADSRQQGGTGETSGTPEYQGSHFFGGMMRANIPGLVGDGPNGQVLPTSEVITPNMNSLVVTMGQMAQRMRPQMEEMANSIRPQMEQAIQEIRPQMEQMANSFRPMATNQMAPQLEQFTSDLNRKFDRLIEAYRENTRAVNLQGRNVFRT